MVPEDEVFLNGDDLASVLSHGRVVVIVLLPNANFLEDAYFYARVVVIEGRVSVDFHRQFLLCLVVEAFHDLTESSFIDLCKHLESIVDVVSLHYLVKASF